MTKTERRPDPISSDPARPGPVTDPAHWPVWTVLIVGIVIEANCDGQTQLLDNDEQARPNWRLTRTEIGPVTHWRPDPAHYWWPNDQLTRTMTKPKPDRPSDRRTGSGRTVDDSDSDGGHYWAHYWRQYWWPLLKGTHWTMTRQMTKAQAAGQLKDPLLTDIDRWPIIDRTDPARYWSYW